MASVPPGAPIAPGIATGNTYPQYGVGGGTPGSAAGWQLVTANNASQKQTYENEGYLVWFSSASAAQSYISSESSPYESGEPQNAIPGLAQVGNFFGALTQGSTWVRVAEVVIGVLLIAVGIAHLTRAVPAATKVAETVGGAAAVAAA